jgi:hypothetical protein
MKGLSWDHRHLACSGRVAQVSRKAAKGAKVLFFAFLYNLHTDELLQKSSVFAFFAPLRETKKIHSPKSEKP